MDEIFREEEQHLKRVLGRLHGEIIRYKKQHRIAKEKADIPAYSLEDIGVRQDYLEDANRALNQIDRVRSYLPEPYFGHMELDYDSTITSAPSTKVFYVGKADIHVDGEQLVVDWRSEMGTKYYQKSETKFTVKGTPYTLALRRALEIKNSRLIGYNTECDATDISLEGRVVDPFLLTVLRDKRRQKVLTHIISTIQENQNHIINQPLEKNFVVQGCAGSGKTMVLLHRLSYLLYNHKNLFRNSVKIITPNEYFNTFINDLSQKLELQEIERFSVEEYYVRLLKSFSGKVSVSSDVTSEMSLPSGFLAEVYSQEFQTRIRQKYADYFDEQISAIDLQILVPILAKNGKQLPDLGPKKAAPVLELQQILTNIQNSYNGVLTKYQQEESRRNDAVKKYTTTVVEAQSHKEKCIASREELQNRLTLRVAQLEEYLCEQKAAFTALQEEYAALGQHSEAAAKELAVLEQHMSEADSLKGSYRDFSSLQDNSSEISQFLLAENRALVTAIEKKQSELSGTPTFNFSKRNKLRSEIKVLSATLSSAVFDGIAQYAEQQLAKIEECRRALPQDPVAAAKNRTQQEKINAIIKEIAAELSACRKCLAQFSVEDFPNLEKVLTKEAYRLLSTIIAPYQSLRSSMKESSRLKMSLAAVIEKCEMNLQQWQAQLPECEEMTVLADALACLEGLEYSRVFSEVVGCAVDKLYEEYQIKKTKKTYRFMLYLQLLFCTLYYRKAAVKDAFLNIDEAQDIAVTEYAVLRSALDEKCVFNLYGDVNQLIYEYKGISDWDDLQRIIHGQVFVLNENYRNTMQITTYCNDVFGAEIYPIGISGEEVQSLALKKALVWIEQKHSAGDRTAILVGETAREDKVFKEMIDTCGFTWMLVDASRPSVITVEMAKGLEFDAVVAVTSGMNDNEKYIAFTRAMDALAVVDSEIIAIDDRNFFGEDRDFDVEMADDSDYIW